MNPLTPSSSQDNEADQANPFFQEEEAPYQADRLETGKGALPPLIRYMPHVIIWGSIGYVYLQAESNAINHLTSAFLVLWSVYNLIAFKKKWPPFP